MTAAPRSRSPHWYGVAGRVVLLTIIGTLLCFAVSLLLGILGTVIISALRGVHADMRIAYRMIALPAAAFAGGIIFVVAVVSEIRHYQRGKVLTTIEKIS